MKPKKRRSIISSIAIFAFILLAGAFVFRLFIYEAPKPAPPAEVRTVFGFAREFGEPFGIIERDGEIFVSDGEKGAIFKIDVNGEFSTVTDKLSTPSAIDLDLDGNLIVADSGSHSIKRVDLKTGNMDVIAGVEGEPGFADGNAKEAKFNGPVGLAVAENGNIYVSDSYNDKIRVIENGKVSTLAGSSQGFAEGSGEQVKFNTPLGLAVAKTGDLIVADTGNSRIRIVDPNGKTGTLAGNGSSKPLDGLPVNAGFVRPTDVAIDEKGAVYIADGNAVRVLGRTVVPLVETLVNSAGGYADGDLRSAKLNRPSGLAVASSGEVLIADSENQVVRTLAAKNSKTGKPITSEEIAKLRLSPQEFRALAEPRWTYDPPDKPREIAGTLGEIRGEIKDENSQAWFHNGLDIVGGFGERARFVRTEKVLDPSAVQNFATLRELIRMPSLGYIHIKLGRNSNDEVFNDRRFIYSLDEKGDLTGLRVARGAKFNAGEPIGTLNAMNHVHLVTGRRGNEFNALDALDLPGISDSRKPTIELVSFFDENWNEIETGKDSPRIKLAGKARIVVKAYDQMDGNADRRRLGVFKFGYQLLDSEKRPAGEPVWTIDFSKLPPDSAVPFVYAAGSRSGATGETIFNYVVTNEVHGELFREGYFDTANLTKGDFVLRILAADYFGNIAEKDIDILIQ